MFPHDLETLARDRQAAALEGAARRRLLQAAREGQRRASAAPTPALRATRAALGALAGFLLRGLAGLTRKTRSPSALEGAHRERLA